MVSKCKHCGERIIQKRTVLSGNQWTHQKEEYSGYDGSYVFCKILHAEPEE